MKNIEPTRFVHVYFHEAGDDPLGKFVAFMLRWSPIGGFGRPPRFVHVSVMIDGTVWSLDDDRARAYDNLQELYETGSGPTTRRTMLVEHGQIAHLFEKLDDNWESHRLSKRRCFWSWLGLRVPPRHGAYTICTDMVADLCLPDGLGETDNWNLTPDELYARLVELYMLQ